MTRAVRVGFGWRIVVGLATFALLQGFLTQPLRAQITTRAEYEACQARDEAGFRAAIEALTLSCGHPSLWS